MPSPSIHMMMQRQWIIRAVAAPPPPQGVVMFYAVYDRIVPAANKYMATLFNTSATRKVVIHRIWQYNWQFAASAGVNAEQYIARITARTVGTSVTIRAEDTSDTVSAGITADTNSTVVTENHIFKRMFNAAEEGSPVGTMLGEDRLMQDRNFQLLYERHSSMKGHTLRQNQGISIRNVTAVTVGSMSYMIEFTDELA